MQKGHTLHVSSKISFFSIFKKNFFSSENTGGGSEPFPNSLGHILNEMLYYSLTVSLASMVFDSE